MKSFLNQILKSSIRGRPCNRKPIQYSFSITVPHKQNMEAIFRRCVKENIEKNYLEFLTLKNNEDYQCQILNNLGKLYHQKKEYEKAIEAFSKAIKVNSKLPELYLSLGTVLIEQDENQTAIDVLDHALRELPGNFQLTKKLTEIYIQLQNYKEAVNYCSKAALIKPLSCSQPDPTDKNMTFDKLFNFYSNSDDESTCLNLKDYFIQQEMTAQGREIFEQTLKIKNTFSLNLAIGTLLFETGEAQEAKPYLSRALEINIENYAANLYLATIALQQQNIDEAISLYEKAIILNTKDSIGLSSLGLIYLKMNKTSKAKQYFLKALEINVNDSIALSSLGVIQLAEGHLKQATLNLKKALTIDPSNQTARTQLSSISLMLSKGDNIQ